MSATSRAVRFATFGEPSDVLTVEPVPIPAPGPGRVLLRMRARPVNPSDLSLVRGRYGELPPLPATPGLEGLGVVEALGDGVDGLAIGARVVPLSAAPGTWAEHLVAPAATLVPVPDGVPDEAAAQLVVNPLTAWVLVEERDDIGARVRDITGGEGAAKAIDAVAGAAGARLADALAPRGTLVTYGRLARRPLELDTGRQIFGGTTVRGFWLVRWFRETPPAEVRAAIDEVLGLMADRTVDPPVEARYDLDEVREAVVHAERPGRSGKVLLVG